MIFEGDSVNISAGVVPYLVFGVEVTSRYVLGVSILICNLVQFFGCDLVAWRTYAAVIMRAVIALLFMAIFLTGGLWVA